ncbi:TIGR00645 family protein [Pigmentibacter ruber]|uniref:TIGR00645 family protein n=1 Tax=Pigmentibacter ruber TaxID=2683196 RepID=UPI00131C3840|nr:TIGR00645 family protein [Pigmentibacter ruber]BFD32429.1 TIGR00645 family protein [Pigmentibacter ruber]
MSSPKKENLKLKIETTLEYIIFASRWLQAPLYFGLIIAQIAYTIKFIQELVHIIGSATVTTELQLLLGILSLVDFTMVANLLAMVIIGGYATFVSKLNVENHDDKPDWLDHIDPGTIKVKLASSLIGISSIHLLRSFIDISVSDIEKIKWQIIIHLTFIASTVFLAISEYIMSKKHIKQTH